MVPYLQFNYNLHTIIKEFIFKGLYKDSVCDDSVEMSSNIELFMWN